MLSTDAVKLLQWLEKHDEWMMPKDIEKECKHFSDRSFKAIIKDGLVDKRLADFDGCWVEYRISDAGRSYLEDVRAQWLPELREWINTALPIITFLAGLSLSEPIKSFFRWLFNLFS